MSILTLYRAASSSTIVHVGFAFLAMGGWAVFANRAHPMPEPIIAGLVQGSLSATITLLMKKALEALSAGFFNKYWLTLALIAPPLIVCSLSLCVLVAVHILAGTPEVFATITLPFTVAFSYACLYSLNLWREGKNNE